MKKGSQKYIFVFLILVVYVLLYLFVFNPKENRGDLKNFLNIIVGNDADFLFYDGKWKNVISTDRTSSNWKKFKIYEDSDYLGEYPLLYTGVWNLKNEDRSDVPLPFDEKLAIRGDISYQMKSFQIIRNTEKDSIVRKVLRESSISEDVPLTVYQTIPIDLDKDGTEEVLYILSNAFIDTEEPDVVFNFVFYVDDGHISIIYKEIFDSISLSDTCKPFISHIFEVKKSTYFIINCAKYSDLGKDVTLYRYNSNKFTKIISN